MFAVVEIAGFQYRVQPSDKLTVPKMDAEVGSAISLTNILAAGEGANVRIGAPTLSGSVTATILAHGKAEKVVVFHKKRRKGYRKKNGHRQHFTQIQIGAIAVA
ncbi:MAG: 50S ribosomal protein L21 [Ignavibacteria bacterium]|jgi:large subunit ribosomal protein L21|nr:50S ribosomal protein L21 [Ignavibacteria bacterium]MBL7990526.1 50S ribosomal protein L21 [Candidatus Kapabacteria bacterium]